MTQLAVAPIKTSYVYTPPVRMNTDKFPLLDPSTLPSNAFWQTLGKACTMRRDYGSTTESAFVAWLANRLPVTLIDAAGNVHVDTRTDPSHRTMFTAHTDTVHDGGGVNKVRVDGDFWRADTGAALGADDGAGLAILCHLLDRGVPGYYVFFRGEERGGVGSSWLAKEMPELFNGVFDRAVAFDRAGYADVITHQSGGRCCSDEFAEALAAQLSTDTDWYAPCSGGVYTDTAEFTKLIPECTNISVGYKNQHGDREEQDVEFLWRLAKRIVSVQWDNLPTARDPKAKPESKYSGYYSRSAWNDTAYEYDYAYDRPVSKDTKALLADDEDDLDGFDSEEYTVLWAIDSFRTGEDKTYLMDLIADAAYPDDPALALRSMAASRITESDLEIAEDMLTDNWPAEQVLLELYEVCQTL